MLRSMRRRAASWIAASRSVSTSPPKEREDTTRKVPTPRSSSPLSLSAPVELNDFLLSCCVPMSSGAPDHRLRSAQQLRRPLASLPALLGCGLFALTYGYHLATPVLEAYRISSDGTGEAVEEEVVDASAAGPVVHEDDATDNEEDAA